jgi:hypothetical protein
MTRTPEIASRTFSVSSENASCTAIKRLWIMRPTTTTKTVTKGNGMNAYKTSCQLIESIAASENETMMIASASAKMPMPQAN